MSGIEIECFYRLLPQLESNGCEEEAAFHYSPYKIFVLETRLYPLIYSLYPNINLEIFLRGKYNEGRNKMVLHLELRDLEGSDDPFVESKVVKINDYNKRIIKSKIAEITSIDPQYALIDINELYQSGTKSYPLSYLKNVLPYVGLDSSFNPFIRPQGIYLSFNPQANYNDAYHEVCGYILQKVEQFYRDGVIVLNDIHNNKVKQKLIDSWKLERLDYESEVGILYQPTWRDNRFAENLVDFLMRKISGDPYIIFDLSHNLVKRHFICKKLQQRGYGLIVESSKLKVLSHNIDESLKIGAIITSSENIAEGRVLTMAANRMSYIYLYIEYSVKKYGNVNVVSYGVNNLQNPYMFSLSLPQDEYAGYDDLRIQFKNYALERLVDVSKITKLKNMSPHDIIEAEMQK